MGYLPSRVDLVSIDGLYVPQAERVRCCRMMMAARIHRYHHACPPPEVEGVSPQQSRGILSLRTFLRQGVRTPE